MKTKFKKILTVLLTFGLLVSLTACGESKIKTISYKLKDDIYSIAIDYVFDQVQKEYIKKDEDLGISQTEIDDLKKQVKIASKFIDKAIINYNFDQDSQKLSNISLNYSVDAKALLSDKMDEKELNKSIKEVNKEFKELHKSFLKEVKNNDELKKYRSMDMNFKMYYNNKKKTIGFKIKINRALIKYLINDVEKEVPSTYLKEIKNSKKMLNCKAEEFKKQSVKNINKEIKKMDKTIDPKDCYEVKVVKY